MYLLSTSFCDQKQKGYDADVHAETPFGWSVLVYAALSDQAPNGGASWGCCQDQILNG